MSGDGKKSVPADVTPSPGVSLTHGMSQQLERGSLGSLLLPWQIGIALQGLMNTKIGGEKKKITPP